MLRFEYRSCLVCYLAAFVLSIGCSSQPLNKKTNFSDQDTLRGSIGPARAWWNVLYYHIYVRPEYTRKTIAGFNEISFGVKDGGAKKTMQIDLQQPMMIDSIIFEKKQIKSFKRNGNVYMIDFSNYTFDANKSSAKEPGYKIRIYFHGKPREASNPPWDGGWVFAKDSLGRPWMTVACQGLGASVWYPCKDHQSDEPDRGAMIQVRVPDSLTAVANGRLNSKNAQGDGTTLYTWEVTSPINNYNIVPYIGKYIHWSDDYVGEKGKKLTLDYWVMDYNLERSKKQFGRDVKPMLTCFEYWVGPYPFYEDGFKLVESSHLGMEHQSATAYGNHYLNGYLGRDLSGTGWGTKWDYIIIHESAHEWFANNITTNDIADMWVHEGFGDYMETLFVECRDGKEAADEYTQGIRKTIKNDRPVIGPYGVNKEGSGDMYSKGSNLLHTIRQVIDDDSRFRQVLRGLNTVFYHKTVDSKEVEAYMSKESGKDLSKIFDQYLRTIKIPVLEYKIQGENLSYRWANCVNDFDMPVRLANSTQWLKPNANWQETTMSAELLKNFAVDQNFYVTVSKVE